MAFCTKCGAAVADNASFCSACGMPQPGASSGPSPASAAAPVQASMSENVAGLLCYLVGWVTGIIFYYIDKRPFVRFHAAQSIVTFGGLQILSFVIAWSFGFSLFAGGFAVFSLGYALYALVELLAVVLWIVLMIKAYQHDRFRVPIAADLAEKIFGKL
jgi:uncharacterized membrane protein